MVEMPGAEQLDRLVDKFLVGVDLRRGRLQIARCIGGNIERHAMPQIPLPEPAAGEEGAVDQRFIIDSFIGDAVARLADRPQRAAGLPARWPGDCRGDRNAPGEPAGRVERNLIWLQTQHVGGGDDAALVAGSR